MTIKLIALAGTAVAMLASSVSAQVLYSVAGSTYSQTFDGLSPTYGTTAVAFSNNSSTTSTRGWYMGNSGTGAVNGTRDIISSTPNMIAGTGSSNSGGAYNYGSTAASDRALGFLSANSSNGGDAVISFVIRNTTGAQLDDVAISYWGEQWRVGNATLTNSFVVDYTLASSFTLSSVLSNSTVGWNSVSALNFTSPTLSTTASALDGNAVANRTQRSTTLSNIAWQDQDYLVIRFWYDRQASGSSNGIAIDDFALTASTVPTPGAIGLAGLGVLVAARRRRA